MNSAMFGPLTTPQYAEGGKIPAPKRRSYEMRTLREIEEDLALQNRERWELTARRQYEAQQKSKKGYADGGQAKPHNPANDYEPGLNRAANLRDGFPPRMSRAEREDLERRFGPLPPKTPQYVVKKAGGGRIGDTASTVKAIKEALSALQSGDRTGAVRILRPHDSNPEIQRTLEMLRGPNSRSADSGLKKSVTPSGLDYTPYLAGGGRVDKLLTGYKALDKWLRRNGIFEVAEDAKFMEDSQQTPLTYALDQLSNGDVQSANAPVLRRAALERIKTGGPDSALLKKLVIELDAMKGRRGDVAYDVRDDNYVELERALQGVRSVSPREYKAEGGRVGAIRDALEAITKKFMMPSGGGSEGPQGAMEAAINPAAIQRAISTLKGPASDADMRMARGYQSSFDPRAALSPSAGGGQLRTLTDRLALLEDAVRTMPAGATRDSIVDEYSGLRRQLSRQTGR